MMNTAIFIVISFCQLLIVLAMVLASWRMLRGPRAQDRIAALDSLYANALILLISISITTQSLLYIEAGLIIALLGFISSSALAKFLMRGEIIE